ncbi:hypothetical protein [Mycobacteroides abscessus]|uniref:Uncharacterized protein n=1 Tax=Mycobacteroides abscessus TaxID=36809 RepID=A0A0U0ZJJ0_9MYCO|nr:hypothetical protein [Mycobacteroides abscessus]ANN99460.1 hypothetical protein BAB74_12555 [Mycobacteroides abscessus]MBE5405915.1 hypothetical protein [Mycobacteroides abscessus]MBE5429374.1 hypothetical protein [Mycobacteroides abscessus]MBE5447042.1 hypothetical protein [Mycobacteroides abscessus]MBE5506327.1 hypothetical protein [Mycobacteroides abscessus]
MSKAAAATRANPSSRLDTGHRPPLTMGCGQITRPANGPPPTESEAPWVAGRTVGFCSPWVKIRHNMTTRPFATGTRRVVPTVGAALSESIS